MNLVAAATLLLMAAQQPSPTRVEDRKAILQALRPLVERQLRGEVLFVVDALRTDADWAFIQAEPQRANGRAIDGARYFPGTWANMDGLTTTAILKRGKVGWRVVEWRIGATDAWYCGPLPGVPYDPCRPKPATSAPAGRTSEREVRD